PRALEEEIDFILETAQANMAKKPTRKDVLATFAALRPLAAPQEEGKSTKEISRSHKIIVSPSKLITITGGKWTTFRKMGEDTVDKAIQVAQLPHQPSQSADVHLYGYKPHPDLSNHMYVYGTEEEKILALIKEDPTLGEKLHPQYDYTYAQVVWAVRHEMARTVEDFLARRIRILFLDAEAAIAMAPQVATLMAGELQQDIHWKEEQLTAFGRLAERYTLRPQVEA
ncbi:MAG: glycerol-3-phosphate dehydrogenase C-terminal domain-containing protein, partial [Bacteroidota bacterium]